MTGRARKARRRRARQSREGWGTRGPRKGACRGVGKGVWRAARREVCTGARKDRCWNSKGQVCDSSRRDARTPPTWTLEIKHWLRNQTHKPETRWRWRCSAVPVSEERFANMISAHRLPARALRG
eukprot:1284746-Rhodomonas_salina.1